MVEQPAHNRLVVGSIPAGPTFFLPLMTEMVVPRRTVRLTAPLTPTSKTPRMGYKYMTGEPESTSESGDQWVSALLNEARLSNPSAANGVFERMESLLKGQFSNSELPPTALKMVAIQLIGDMIPKPIELEETQ